jgi:type II secretory pathway component PulJ
MRGFTLLDTLIAIVIFSFIIAGIYGVVTTADISYANDTTLMYLGQQARQVMFWLIKDMREAVSLSINNVDNDSDIVVFSTADESNVRYYLNGGQVIREYPLNNMRVMGNNITRFRAYRSGNLIDIDLIADREISPDLTLSFPLKEKIRLRNE